MIKEAMQMMEDSELVARAKDGDIDAFGELYERYLDLIYRYIRARVTENRNAEDLTEVVFLHAFKAVERYQERGFPFSAYLYQVARNLLVDHYRAEREEGSLETVEQHETLDPSLDESVMVDEHIQDLRSALEQLPKDYQEIIRLRVLLDLPSSTVAQWMGRKEGAMRVLLHRALKALKRKMVRIDE